MRLIVPVCILVLWSCNGGPTAQAQAPNGDNQDPAPVASEEPSPYTQYFDASRSWQYLLDQVDLGFRVPGTKVHRQCRRYLQEELEQYCDIVVLQEFQHKFPAGLATMWNIIGRFDVDNDRRIILGAHWDTRPTADYNPPGQQNQPIAGANDGASGVAVLLELARVFSEHRPTVGVDVVLFDGEDYGPGLDQMLLGSKYFASQLTQGEVNSYNYGILLDMIGDSDLGIHPERNSEGACPLVYLVAHDLSNTLGYYNAFRKSRTIAVTDDHVPLIERGVRMYDFIDFRYDYWHTTEDTPDKCSPDSLEAVGRTVENMVLLYPDLYAPD